MISTGREAWRGGWEVSVRTDLKDEVHADDNVEEEVAVEEPEAGVVGPETQDDVAVVGHGDGVLRGRVVSLLEVTVQQTAPVEVQRVLQVDLLHVLVGRAADTDHVERVAVEVEGVRQIGNLYWNQTRSMFRI